MKEVRRKRIELNARKREHIQMRMEKAEENRQKSISEIVKKARERDVKVFKICYQRVLVTLKVGSRCMKI